MFNDYEIIEDIIHLYKDETCFILGSIFDFEIWIEANYDLSGFETKVAIDNGDSEFQNVMAVDWSIAREIYYDLEYFNEYFNTIK